ncbi:unnamed protein product [Pieris macdunnoughi]|uniref:Reverse transcriptase Ty1/copia-type domain-containing protein n=1 Tax=Pieris macdunnoughi TaxID=345717 RepID=A0A821VT00_9NEOP|nr:unnamed protein product [Pieris macdunnoughi]
MALPKPDLGKIKIFGCPVYSLIHEEDRNGKLCERSKRLFMAGSCDNGFQIRGKLNLLGIPSKFNFLIFDESRTTDLTNEGQFTNPDTVQIPCVDHETKSEVFQSSDVEQVLQPMLEDEDLPILEDEDFQSDKNIDTVKKTSRIRKPPKYLKDFVTNFAFDALALSASSDLDVPNNYTDAVQDAGWRQAIDEELKSLEDNGTWEVVDSPIDATVIDSRWVFTTKIVDGAVMKKARLVARGYQQPSLEDENIFAPVARLTTLRVLLAVAVERGLHIHQLDVKSAFLKSNLPVSVFMKPPEGLKCDDGKVLKLIKALYGLKQSPKAWNDFVNDIFIKIGFSRSQKDPCLYVKGSTFILVWVDDFLLVSESLNDLQSIKSHLIAIIDVRDLTSSEELQFLCIKILTNENGSTCLVKPLLFRKLFRDLI